VKKIKLQLSNERKKKGSEVVKGKKENTKISNELRVFGEANN
jgi:hypothetical protein